MRSQAESVEFLATLARYGGDGEEAWVKLAVPQTEIDKLKPMLDWGKQVLVVTVVKETVPVMGAVSS